MKGAYTHQIGPVSARRPSAAMIAATSGAVAIGGMFANYVVFQDVNIAIPVAVLTITALGMTRSARLSEPVPDVESERPRI